MPSLLELQTDFAAALFGRPRGNLWPSVVDDRVSAPERFAVYQGSVVGNYCKALRAVYPVVERLVGERFFAHAAKAYACQVPSLHGDLNRYGAGFAAFLASFPGAAELAYLPDTARLEWAIESVFHASDAPPHNVEGLANADWAQLRFRLPRSCHLLASPWPVHRLWQLNQPGVEWDEAFDIDSGGVYLLVRRSGFEVELEPLEEGAYLLLTALAAGTALGEACERALADRPDFDVGAALQRHLLAGTFLLR
ncbi:MAG: putative DNA-binding domain-containing protein [Zoogloeaceae bacterium]|nr:putative DNA-binding domain-containing protein [Zoogloeaceae bacterium]